MWPQVGPENGGLSERHVLDIVYSFLILVLGWAAVGESGRNSSIRTISTVTTCPTSGCTVSLRPLPDGGQRKNCEPGDVFSSLHHSGLAVYEIDDTVALLGNVLFRNHLDCLLCDHTSHEGSGVWNIGGGSTSTGVLSVGFDSRKYGLTYSSPITFLMAVCASSAIWAPPNNACTSASSSSSVGVSGPEFCPSFTMYDDRAEKPRWIGAKSGASWREETARKGLAYQAMVDCL